MKIRRIRRRKNKKKEEKGNDYDGSINQNVSSFLSFVPYVFSSFFSSSSPSEVNTFPRGRNGEELTEKRIGKV